jgi:hypothetical protein
MAWLSSDCICEALTVAYGRSHDMVSHGLRVFILKGFTLGAFCLEATRFDSF